MIGRRVLGSVVVLSAIAASCGSAGDSDDATAVTTSQAALNSTTTAAPAATTTAAATTEASAPSTSSTPTTTEAPIVAGLVCTAGEPQAPDPGARAGSERIDAFGITQVWVPRGSFTMGTADAETLDPPGFALEELAGEQPAHDVTITTGFWMDKYEVTNEAYAAFIAAGAYEDPACWSEQGWEWRQSRGDRIPVTCGGAAPDHPRACVTWIESEAYAIWRGAALPTEAQWEYAARGRRSLIYPWGNEWDAQRANVVDATATVPVGSFPNGDSWVGAHDMSGNVMEWVADWLSFEYYADSPSEDPQGPAQGRVKVEKGGWWGSVPYVARAAYRHFEDSPRYQDEHIGFRVVSR